MPVLLKFEMDYADEFDVYGFRVVTDQEWDKFLKVIECLSFPLEAYFGTNEQVVFENKEEILQAFKMEKISLDDEKVLTKLFAPPYKDSDVAFGWDPFDYFQENISEEDYYRIYPENKVD